MSSTVNSKLEGSTLTIALSGRVDAANAPDVEREIAALRAQAPGTATVIDAEQLEYISSAGLRIFLRLRKQEPNLAVINVSSEVYEILDMTGFTEMLTVQKAYRRVSVEGCSLIGKGANGAVYRLDAETIIKVYFNPDALPEIQRERELARKALVMGINTAIPYDVVRVGTGYGTVMELLDAESLSVLIRKNAAQLETPIRYYVDLLQQLHTTMLQPGELPDMKQLALSWAEFDRDYLPAPLGDRLCRLVQAVPDSCNMLHGDYHPNNVMVRDGEALLIDMDTLCMGHPIFELGSMYNAFRGFGELDPTETERFIGLPFALAGTFWRGALASYLGTDDEARIDEVEEKAKIVGLMRLLRRTARRQEPNREAQLAYYQSELTRLLPKIDRLSF